MPYIGRPLNAGNLAVQSGTGDGSDTTPIATLDYSVGSSNSIGVYLDGVRQLAGTDFTASGTVLTFTTAPANLVGIDVYFLGLELSIPTPGDDTVTGAKIVDNAINSEHYTDGSIDLAHMSSQSVDEDNLHISNAGSNGQFLSKQSGNAGGLTWAAGSSVGASAMLVTTAGLANKTGNNETYTVVWETEVYDIASNMAAGTFTAPTTGKYLLCANVFMTGITAATADLFDVIIVTSNKSYGGQKWQGTNFLNTSWGGSLAIVADMDSSDTAHVTARVLGLGSTIVDIDAFSSFSATQLF